MSRRTRRPGHDDSELLRALRSLADDCEPDVTAIELRLDLARRHSPERRLCGDALVRRCGCVRFQCESGSG